MKQKNNDEEIDLIQIVIIIWNNKLKVILPSILAVISIILYYQINHKKLNSQLIHAKTKIETISTFDLLEYQLYNRFVEKLNSENLVIDQVYNNKGKDSNDEDISFEIIRNKLPVSSSYVIIDKLYLMDLFIEKLKENKIFIEGIKQFKLIKTEDFTNNEEYENAVKKMASSISIIPVYEKGQLDKRNSNWNIEAKIKDEDTWEKLLNFVEIKTNDEIRGYLVESFKRYVSNEIEVNNFFIEDIDFQISIEEDMVKKQSLNLIKEEILKKKNIERLIKQFNSTPIVKLNNFHAAKVIIHATDYENLQIYNFKLINNLILAAFIGLVLGIFYVLFENAIKKRKKI